MSESESTLINGEHVSRAAGADVTRSCGGGDISRLEALVAIATIFFAARHSLATPLTLVGTHDRDCALHGRGSSYSKTMSWRECALKLCGIHPKEPFAARQI